MRRQNLFDHQHSIEFLSLEKIVRDAEQSATAPEITRPAKQFAPLFPV